MLSEMAWRTIPGWDIRLCRDSLVSLSLSLSTWDSNTKTVVGSFGVGLEMGSRPEAEEK